MYYAINANGNSKTQIPTTTSHSGTCPTTCPMIEKGCYAKTHHLGRFWKKLDKGENKEALTFEQLCLRIRALPKGAAWRHNQAGDLPHKDGHISHSAISALVKANKGKRGFTYTHHATSEHNMEAIDFANGAGFTINLSANTLEEADTYKALDWFAPVVTLLPMDAPKVSFTPAGNKVVACPAEKSKVTCATCMLCAKPDRDYIIGFRAHGSAKKSVDIIARG